MQFSPLLESASRCRILRRRKAREAGYNASPLGGLMKRIACLIVTLMVGSVCFAQTANKDAVQNPGFPRVVARLNLFNRTKAIGPQTLYTPTKAGVYRVSGTMACTIGNGSIDFPAWNSLL